MLPPRLALKIFSTQIAPILLYDAEVWAAYSNFKFSNWDKTCIERTHTQFLKRILGCDIHSPNLMVSGELGKRPLLCDAIRRSVLYIKQVALYTGTLAYHALDQELFLNDESNIFYLARMYTPYFNETNYYRSPKDKKEVKHITNECYDKVWQTGIKLMSKADTFLSFKKIFHSKSTLG